MFLGGPGSSGCWLNVQYHTNVHPYHTFGSLTWYRPEAAMVEHKQECIRAFPRAFSTLPPSSNVFVFNGHFVRFYPNLVAEVWFAYPKDPASWGELQADYDSDSTMNVHEKVHMTK